MKKAYLSLVAIAALTIASCGGGEEKKEDKEGKDNKEVKDTTNAEKEITYTTYVLDTAATTLTWHGTHTGKPDKHHVGTVDVVKGTLTASLADAKIESGQFVIDLTTLKSTDLEGKAAENLIGHLKTPDFFNVEQAATATLVVTGIENGAVKGRLAVAGKEFDVTMPIQLSENAEGQLIANGSFEVDFASANMPGMQPEEGKEDKGHVNTVVKYDLNLVMNKQ